MSGATERDGETASSPASSLKTVSDDEEIDYTVKPEFYDSEVDDKDESWVTNKRKGRYSDAVLSCPACFTILCYESQRHETYVTQYRAMFVVNCKIKNDQVLPQESRKQKRQKARQSSTNESNSQTIESVDRQVCCDVCATEVGVIDEDEVYHFYDVIPKSLRNATKDYSTLIGFGCVYKGILRNGRKVGIKKVKRSSSLEHEHKTEFFPMFGFLSHIQHRNILQVIGCCLENDHRIVVHEYAENGSVSDILGDPNNKRSVFNWERRVVCNSTASCLSYLHEDVDPRIIHRDIKASKVLLDDKFNPKIAYFDLEDFVYQ